MIARRRTTDSLASQWTRLMLDSAALGAASQAVVAKRLWFLGTNSHRPGSSRRELSRMASEKILAGFAAANQMTLAAMSAGVKLIAGLPMVTSEQSNEAFASGIGAAALKVARAGMVPIQKQVRANAARLRNK